MSKRRYEFAIDGSNDVFGQDETRPELALPSISEARKALNGMALDCIEWLDENGKPLTVVELRRQDDHTVVAIFVPRAQVAHRFADGGVSKKVVWLETGKIPDALTERRSQDSE